MRIAILCVLACQIAIVLSAGQCLIQQDCPTDGPSCGEGFETHCVDNSCTCLHESPVPCTEDKDCELAHHNHEHCGAHNSREWKCSHHSRCYCVKD